MVQSSLLSSYDLWNLTKLCDNLPTTVDGRNLLRLNTTDAYSEIRRSPVEVLSLSHICTTWICDSSMLFDGDLHPMEFPIRKTSANKNKIQVYQVTRFYTSFIGKMLVPLGWYPSCLTTSCWCRNWPKNWENQNKQWMHSEECACLTLALARNFYYWCGLNSHCCRPACDAGVKNVGT